MDVIETDYLVIGAGASAMAFVDTLLTESTASVVMIDRRAQPGGHWIDAYPFVRLHQPSAFYGVSSRELGSGAIDAVGYNQGLYELASGAEVVDYYQQVMNQRFLPSGRVHYFPMSEYVVDGEGAHWASSLLANRRTRIRTKKIVDATHAHTELPSTHPPKYTVHAGVTCIPLNALPTIRRPPSGYVVVGSGKTGCDAILWLLQHGVAPSAIRWIMPRDPWLLDRANFQPGLSFFERSISSLTTQFDAISNASSLPDLFARLESAGQIVRIDPAVEPTTFRCSITSQAEVAQLRRIENIVRLGRVTAVEPTRIVLERGTIAHDPGRVIVDCSACGTPWPTDLPVFDGDRINLQFVASCQASLSAAVVACVESHVADPVEKNALCRVVPTPSVPVDWVRMWSVYLGNRLRWTKHPVLAGFLAKTRLDSLTTMTRDVTDADTEKKVLLHRYRRAVLGALVKLPKLMAQLAPPA